MTLLSVTSVQRLFFFLFRQNEGDRSVKLKCSSVKEAEDWREALEAESAVPVDSSHVSVESPVTEVTTYVLSLVNVFTFESQTRLSILVYFDYI